MSAIARIIAAPAPRWAASETPDYNERAWRIVDRVLPQLPVVSGWDDPQGFMAGSRRLGERKRLYWRTFARLRAKAEGGRPYLAIPPGCEHLWGPGTALFDVARELDREASWNALAPVGLLPLTEDERRFVNRADCDLEGGV